MSIHSFKISRPQPARVQIAEHVRSLIQSGGLAPGERLASTQELARTWETPVSTVQDALRTLVREGLLTRTPRVGTFVTERRPALTRAAVYLPRDVWADADNAFVRALCAAITRRLARDGCEAEMLVDPRPAKQQDRAWQRLARACRRRETHAVIAPQVDAPILSWLGKLDAPLAVLTPTRMPNAVSFDTAQFARDALRELARRGCRRVGAISVHGRRSGSSPSADGARFRQAFESSARDGGLELRPEWFVLPRSDHLQEKEADRFGHDAFERLWFRPERPDGLVVYTDVAARGVLLAVARHGVRVPDELKLVLHRNDEVGLLCPMDASFMDVKVSRVANALVESVMKQFRGAEVGHTVVPYELARA